MQKRWSLPRPSRLNGWLGYAVPLLFVLPLFASEGRAGARPRSRVVSVAASSCSEACDKKASDCVDACEDKIKEDAPRVKCKMGCIDDRAKCEKDCK
jgi:hypothetical protein